MRTLLLIALGLIVFIHEGGVANQAKETPSHRAPQPEGQSAYRPRPAGTLTFSKDIAPVIWNRCAPCHRSGQVAPFALLSYPDVKSRARQIAAVTENRIMPPWLPEPGYGDFVGARRLTVDELGVIQQWLSEGAVEGNPSDLQPAPMWPGGWSLGKPDLVVTVPQRFTLPAEGQDVYRNFVIPIPGGGRRYVRGLELRPDNARIVHHAFMYIDRTRTSRRLAAKGPIPGFAGMQVPETAKMPDGQFSSYLPGMLPLPAPEGQAWALEEASDLVLQLHMHPTGKPEVIQPSVALYFTDQPPTVVPDKLFLTSTTIDIPAGKTNYAITDSFTLPVEVSVLRVLPHAHYLAREISAAATLPDGTAKPLILIRNWDFSWQGDYEYAAPIVLPKGTKVTVRFTYDNSSNNVHNPNSPPRRVTYGPESTDEMAELWLQVLVRTSNDRKTLDKAFDLKLQQLLWQRDQYLLRRDVSR